MKASYRQAANDDVVRQFRYYLVTLNVPDVAVRFRDAVRGTVQSLCQHPLAGHTILRATRIFKICAPGLAGFEAIRIYYLVDEGAIRVIRILHGKRDVKRILEGEQGL